MTVTSYNLGLATKRIYHTPGAVMAFGPGDSKATDGIQRQYYGMVRKYRPDVMQACGNSSQMATAGGNTTNVVGYVENYVNGAGGIAGFGVTPSGGVGHNKIWPTQFSDSGTMADVANFSGLFQAAFPLANRNNFYQPSWYDSGSPVCKVLIWTDLADNILTATERPPATGITSGNQLLSSGYNSISRGTGTGAQSARWYCVSALGVVETGKRMYVLGQLWDSGNSGLTVLPFATGGKQVSDYVDATWVDQTAYNQFASLWGGIDTWQIRLGENDTPLLDSNPAQWYSNLLTLISMLKAATVSCGKTPLIILVTPEETYSSMTPTRQALIASYQLQAARADPTYVCWMGSGLLAGDYATRYAAGYYAEGSNQGVHPSATGADQIATVEDQMLRVPRLLSATINSSASTYTEVWSEPVAGGHIAQPSRHFHGASVGITLGALQSGDGTDTRVYALVPTGGVSSRDTVTVDIDADAVESNDADLFPSEAITGFSVTNNATAQAVADSTLRGRVVMRGRVRI